MDRTGNVFSQEELLTFLENNKKRGAKSLEALREVIENIDANFNHPLGRELLHDDMLRFNYLLTKIIKEDANEYDRAEFRVVKSRLDNISQRMDIYLNSLKKIGGQDGR
jgi:hypothetical protein